MDPGAILRHSASHEDWHPSAKAGIGATATGASTSAVAKDADARRARILSPLESCAAWTATAVQRAAGRALTPDLRATRLAPNATADIVGIERRRCTRPEWRGLTRTQISYSSRGDGENTVVASYELPSSLLSATCCTSPHPLAWRERHSFRRLPAASCSYVGFAYRTVDAFVADPPKNDELDDDLAFAESSPPLPAAASFF